MTAAGGVGGHCIKTWSVIQGGYALNSAEAGFFATIEAVIRDKGSRNVAVEVGFRYLSRQQCGQEFCGQAGSGEDEAFGDT